MSRVPRRRNFFYDEESIVEETRRLNAEIEAEDARQRQLLLDEANRAASKRKQSTQDLVLKGLSWLTGIKAPPIDTDFFLSQEWYFEELFDDTDFYFQSSTLQQEIIENQNLSDEGKNLLVQVFEEIGSDNIPSFILTEERVKDELDKLESFRKIRDYLKAKHRYQPVNYRKVKIKELTKQADEILAIYIDPNNHGLYERLTYYDDIFIDYRDLLPDDVIQHLHEYDNNYGSYYKIAYQDVLSKYRMRFINCNKIIIYDRFYLFSDLNYHYRGNDLLRIKSYGLAYNIQRDWITYEHIIDSRHTKDKGYNFTRQLLSFQDGPDIVNRILKYYHVNEKVILDYNPVSTEDESFDQWKKRLDELKDKESRFKYYR